MQTACGLRHERLTVNEWNLETALSNSEYCQFKWGIVGDER